MVIIDTVINSLLFGGLTLDPAGMHCPSWDDAFVSSSIFNGLRIITSEKNCYFIGPPDTYS